MKIQSIILPPSRFDSDITSDIISDRYFLPLLGDSKIIDLFLSELVRAGTDHIGIIINNNPLLLTQHISTGKDWNMFDKILSIYPEKQYISYTDTLFYMLHSLNNIKDFLSSVNADFFVIVSSDIIFNEDINSIINSITENNYSLGIVRGINKSDISLIVCNRYILEKLIVITNEDEFEIALKTLYEKNLCSDYFLKKPYFPIKTVEDYYNTILLFCNDEALRYDYLSGDFLKCKKYNNPPCYFDYYSTSVNSLFGSGNEIFGRIFNSAIFSNCKIEEYSMIRNCLIFDNCTIGKNCELTNVIVPKGKTVKNGTILIGTNECPIIYK